MSLILGVITLLALASSPRAQDSAAAARYWAQWRGPHATGVSTTANPPLEWSETKNVHWKVEIPGRGSASPVVWGDRLFMLPRGACRPVWLATLSTRRAGACGLGVCIGSW